MTNLSELAFSCSSNLKRRVFPGEDGQYANTISVLNNLVAITILWPTMEPLYIPSSPNHTLQKWIMFAPEEERLGRENINCFSPPSQTGSISTLFPALPLSSYSALLQLWQSVKADTVCRRSVERFWLPRRWVAEGGVCARGHWDCPGLWIPEWIMFIREQIQVPPWD